MTRLPQRHGPQPLHPRPIGLALGGGGARGLAHILILEVFDELGIKPAVIAGTSIGAIFGAAYAAGISAARLRSLAVEALGNRWGMVRQLVGARSTPHGRLLRLVPLRSALFSPQALLDVVLPDEIPDQFSGLKIPLKLTATSLATHESEVFSHGNLRTAIAASMAIPVVFSPVLRDGSLYLDGGLTNPCPFDLVMAEGRSCIAIDVSGGISEARIGTNPSAMTVAVQTVQIVQKAITTERLRHQKPDLYLDVGLDAFGAFDFYRAPEILEAAEPAKAEFRSRLLRLLSSVPADQGDGGLAKN